MKIDESFLQESNQLYNIINSDKLYKKLSWVVNYENGQSVSNKISDDSKISLVTFNDDGVLRIYGSERSNGKNDFCKVKYFLCEKNTKKVEKILIVTKIFIILDSPLHFIYNWQPTITADKKNYIEVYE